MLSGLMMQIAMQLGLHRPVQAEEFTTFRMEVQGEAMKDRLQTWVICNIVAQKYIPSIPILFKSFFANKLVVLLLATDNRLARFTTGH